MSSSRSVCFNIWESTVEPLLCSKYGYVALERFSSTLYVVRRFKRALSIRYPAMIVSVIGVNGHEVDVS